jgi:hypothetical protein
MYRPLNNRFGFIFLGARFPVPPHARRAPHGVLLHVLVRAGAGAQVGAPGGGHGPLRLPSLRGAHRWTVRMVAVPLQRHVHAPDRAQHPDDQGAHARPGTPLRP